MSFISWQNKYFRIVCLAVLGILAAISLVQGVKNALHFSQDLQWDAAKALLLKYDPYDISLSEKGLPVFGEDRGGMALKEFYDSFDAIGAPQKMEANQFPSLLVLLFPLCLFPWGTAKVLWLFLNLCFSLGIAILLKKTFFNDWSPHAFCALALLMVAGTPWRNQLGVGQHTLFAFFFFLLAVYLEDNPVWSGLALAVSYFKYTLTAPLALYFLYKRKWKAFSISVAVHIILNLLMSVYTGIPIFAYIIKPLRVSSRLSGEGSIDIGALTGGAGYWVFICLGLALVLLFLAFRLPKGFEREYFSLLLLMSLVLTYHRSYDFFVLAAAAAGVAGLDRDKNPRLLFLCYGLLILYIFFGLRLFGENNLAMGVATVLYYGFTVFYAFYFFKRTYSNRSLIEA